jgi:preprotein translocase subunit YajC
VNGFLLVLLVLFALMWFIMIRPQRAQQRRHQQLLDELKVGDEIVTVGGIYGEVKSLDDERVRLEVDADVELVVSRRAIANIVPPEEEVGAAAESGDGEQNTELDPLEPRSVPEPETAEERDRAARSSG